jgi:hypothetical protein
MTFIVFVRAAQVTGVLFVYVEETTHGTSTNQNILKFYVPLFCNVLCYFIVFPII